MKLPYEDRVLRPDSLRSLELADGANGFTLDVRMNYYRGQPVSAIEKLELVVDGELIPEQLILVEINDKLLPMNQVALAFTEHWSVKGVMRLNVFGDGLAPGKHQVDLTLHLRNVSMMFGPGMFGMIDSSSSRELELGAAA